MTGPTLGEARRNPLGDGMRRICGVHVQKDGQLAAVWLAHDRDADRLVVFDTYKSERAVVAIQADALNRRGKWIPIAWNQDAKEYTDLFLDHGCNVIPEGVKYTDRIAEAMSAEILTRMETGRFKVRDHLTDWLEELNTFHRRDGLVTMDTHPLMMATHVAVKQREWAKTNVRKKLDKPRVAIV